MFFVLREDSSGNHALIDRKVATTVSTRKRLIFNEDSINRAKFQASHSLNMRDSAKAPND
jgi:hypothetical protein